MRKTIESAAEENEEKMIADKRIWEFIELVARGNTEMLELEKLASNLIEEKYESEQTKAVQFGTVVATVKA